jgi:hypothetical protein
VTPSAAPGSSRPPLPDAAIPRRLATPGARQADTRWDAGSVARLVEHLARAGGPALAAVRPQELAAAWLDTVAAFRDPASAERRRLAAPLARTSGLSPEGLDAGLEVVLRGVAGEAAEALLRGGGRGAGSGLVAVVLASNLPGLAVQPLLRALAGRRPVVLKSASSEPLFAPAFVAALCRREPRLDDTVAAATWTGGDRDLEAPLLKAAREVVVYGEDETLADLARRAPGKVSGHGPRASLAVLGPGADPREMAAGLARDTALFDQRGCLSLQAVYAPPEMVPALAAALAGALGRAARELPPGPLDPALAARVQQARAEAEMRGLALAALPLATGTVIVEPDPAFRPSPGLRTLRVHPLDPLAAPERLAELLAPWRGRLQGVALAGRLPTGLPAALAALGVTRTAAPGGLQAADAGWDNAAALS